MEIIKKFLVTIVLLIISSGLVNACIKQNDVEIPKEDDLKKMAYTIIDYIAEENKKGIINLLDKESSIRVFGDAGLTWQEVENEFHKRGWIYKRMFDTKGHLEYHKEFIIQNKASIRPDELLSIKDNFIEARKKGINIKLKPIVTALGLEYVSVTIDWKGKPDNYCGYGFWARYKNGRWVLADIVFRDGNI